MSSAEFEQLCADIATRKAALASKPKDKPKAEPKKPLPVVASTFPWRRLAIYCLVCLAITAGFVGMANLFAGGIYAAVLVLGWLLVSRLRPQK